MPSQRSSHMVRTSAFTESIDQIRGHTTALLESSFHAPLPSQSALRRAEESLPSSLPGTGVGDLAVVSHLLEDVTPALPHGSLSPNYYGFVTGGVTPAAFAAEQLVGLYDVNVQVHLPAQSIATTLEHKAIVMLMELFKLRERAENTSEGGHSRKQEWDYGALTTGATAANVLGLACGREWAIREAGRRNLAAEECSVGEMGLLEACAQAGIRKIKVLSTRAHSCLGKAASVVGLGRSSLVDVGSGPLGLSWDWTKLEAELAEQGSASIVAVSCAEVNTGGFATMGIQQMQQLRRLVDKYGAWLHVDAAFGIFGRCLPSTDEFASILEGVAGLEIADSIAGDGHKMLNVPYDCGFFFARHDGVQYAVFQNANAAYLGGAGSDVPSPLNVGLENSKRFRALPVYATLLAYGSDGHEDMVARQVRLTRKLARWIDNQQGYELASDAQRGNGVEDLFTIIIFRATDSGFNEELVHRINSGREMYVSGTKWDGQPACRIAVSNWQVKVERDFELVTSVLHAVLQTWSDEKR